MMPSTTSTNNTSAEPSDVPKETTTRQEATCSARPKKHKNLRVLKPAVIPGAVVVSARTASPSSCSNEAVNPTANLLGSRSSIAHQGLEDDSSKAHLQRKGLRGNQHHNQRATENAAAVEASSKPQVQKKGLRGNHHHNQGVTGTTDVALARTPTESDQTTFNQSIMRHSARIPRKGLRENQGVSTNPSNRIGEGNINGIEERPSSGLADMDIPLNSSMHSFPPTQPHSEVSTNNDDQDSDASPSQEASFFLVEATLVTEEDRRTNLEAEQEGGNILVEAHKVQMTDLLGDRRLQLLLLAGCVILVGVIVVLAVILPSRGSSNGKEPTVSAQQEATEWLEAFPGKDSLPQWQQEQLFALATTAYAVNVVDWLNYNETECEWRPPDLSSDPDCKEGIYRILSLPQTNTKQTGTIPPEVSLLSSLVLLNLDTNFLSGGIPSEIGLMANLLHFSARSNRLQGALPSEIGLLSNLELLDLSHNALNGTIPLELFSLTGLEALQLDGNLNKITGNLASEFGQLTQLKELALTRNSLTGSIASQLGQMTSLEKLDLRHNKLVGDIPSQLGLLTNLRVLLLNGNLNDGMLVSLPLEVEILRENLDSQSNEALNALGSQNVQSCAVSMKFIGWTLGGIVGAILRSLF